MVQDESREESERLTPLPPEEKTLIEQTIDSVFEADIDEALPLLESRMQALDPQAAGTATEIFQIILQSMWNFFQAMTRIRTQANFVEARDLFESAEDGFSQVGHDELRDLSIGLGVYAEAVVNLQEGNIGQALELLTEVKDYLRNAGKFSRKFEPLIDHMEPENLFLAGSRALQNLDFASAKPLIEKAAQTAEELAHTYYAEGVPLYYTYQGLACLYKAFYTFFEACNELHQFEYDKLATRQDLVHNAMQAQELLNKGDTSNVVFRNASHISRAIAHLLEVINQLAQIMRRIFSATFKPDLRTLMLLKQKIRIANNSAAEAGPQAATFLRLCDQLSNQINNLEKLAKPDKKDFGAFSGLVSSAIFLPMFLIITWTSSTFGVGLKASTIIYSCLTLSLIAGFGVGALKFKSLIMPSRTDGEPD